ncbi:MAG: hypothetical protein IT319_06685 [Anaerolineae bacterium]|nr:hypothetical protein [Anaerolineae bacterium]
MLVLAMLSAALIGAQEATEEATEVPSSFSDNRINGDIYLAGLAVYCTDENGNTDSNTYQNGGISVWGADGQEYIVLTVDQLRGDEEISQPVVPMETTQEAMTPTETATPAPTVEAVGTEEVMPEPVLLARAETMNGTIWLFRIADDVFALQGNDEHGKFYTYTWTGCSLGVLSTETAPFAGLDFSDTTGAESMATEEMMPAETLMPTEEATAQS